MEVMSNSRNCCSVNLPSITIDEGFSISLDGNWEEFELEASEDFLLLRLRHRCLREGIDGGGGKLRGQTWVGGQELEDGKAAKVR